MKFVTNSLNHPANAAVLDALTTVMARYRLLTASLGLCTARALILDLRDNGGGEPAMVMYMASYLFDRRTHLNDLWTRRTGATEEFWTRDSVPGARFGGTKPVDVLTSSRTFSGGEEFTYDLQQLQRATIVGETTGGGAHPMDQDVFSAACRNTPMKLAKLRGLQRNAVVVLRDTYTRADQPPIERMRQQHEPVMRVHAACDWRQCSAARRDVVLPDTTHAALVLPFVPPRADRLVAILIAGLSIRPPKNGPTEACTTWSIPA